MVGKYINTLEEDAISKFDEALFNCLKEMGDVYDEIVLLCIGTDRATGDSLGPLTGYKLAGTLGLGIPGGIGLYGTLENPVHAKNLDSTVERIYGSHKNPLVIAVDASLGVAERVGHLYFGHGALAPGAGLNKKISAVGDVFVTGIVNAYGVMEFLTLQNTRLNVVMRMADVICAGMVGCLRKLRGENGFISYPALPES